MTKTRFKAVSKTVLARAYNISLHTMKKWMIPIESDLGKCSGQILTPKQVASIVKHLGEPVNMDLISV